MLSLILPLFFCFLTWGLHPLIAVHAVLLLSFSRGGYCFPFLLWNTPLYFEIIVIRKHWIKLSQATILFCMHIVLLSSVPVLTAGVRAAAKGTYLHITLEVFLNKVLSWPKSAACGKWIHTHIYQCCPGSHGDFLFLAEVLLEADISDSTRCVRLKMALPGERHLPSTSPSLVYLHPGADWPVTGLLQYSWEWQFYASSLAS